MTEQLREHSGETLHNEADSKAERKNLEEKLEKAKGAEHLDVGEARKAVEHLSPVSHESHSAEQHQDQVGDVHWWSKELSSQTFDRTLTSVRRKLSPPERTFSKIVHNRAVENTSDIVGKTVARPSGVLYGGLFSFVFSLGAYLLARHLGGEMRPNFFIITFVGGYIFGLFIELIVRVSKSKNRRA